MKRLLCRALMVIAGVLYAPGMASSAHANSSDAVGVAWFEDHWIDLAVDWEGATACAVGPLGAVCFRTEEELEATLSKLPTSSDMVALAGTCSSALRLYNGISYTGNVLVLTSTNAPINLSSLGFDNLTTSYKVGACDAGFYSGANLGGSAYPGNTAAFAQSPNMITGWNNTTSSVYIN